MQLVDGHARGHDAGKDVGMRVCPLHACSNLSSLVCSERYAVSGMR